MNVKGGRYARWVAPLAIGSLLGVSLGCTDPMAPPSEPPDASAFNVLFIGNSLTYANDLPVMLRGLLVEAGLGPVEVAQVAFPNYGLEDHWLDGRARAAIELGGWDYVVMQQGPSATEGRPSLLEYSRRFGELARAIGATPALYMVWPATERSFDFDGVAASYALAADSAQGILFPAGEAWRAAWRRDPNAQLYGPDGFHPSAQGSYLAALTMADRLVGESFAPSFAGAPIPSGYGPLLLESARAANATYP
ncbi:MAG: SGNH/GDSL hydrolase family protein [Gemmatimonadota bacterium]